MDDNDIEKAVDANLAAFAKKWMPHLIAFKRAAERVAAHPDFRKVIRSSAKHERTGPNTVRLYADPVEPQPELSKRRPWWRRIWRRRC